MMKIFSLFSGSIFIFFFLYFGLPKDVSAVPGTFTWKVLESIGWMFYYVIIDKLPYRRCDSESAGATVSCQIDIIKWK